jgi:DNA repair protein RadA/Sms
LDARCGLTLGGRDVYLNVAGGLRISEPGADLAVAAALVSALTGVPAPEGAVVFGEIGLSGEIRAVSQADLRLKEAAKLGFTRALAPAARQRRQAALELDELTLLSDLVRRFEAGSEGVQTWSDDG